MLIFVAFSPNLVMKKTENERFANLLFTTSNERNHVSVQMLHNHHQRWIFCWCFLSEKAQFLNCLFVIAVMDDGLPFVIVPCSRDIIEFKLCVD
jgi:hypothetical protein